MEEKWNDKHIAHIGKYPKFKRIPKHKRKVKIKKGFRSLFQDKKTLIKYTVDKTEQPANQTSEKKFKKENRIINKNIKKKTNEQNEHGMYVENFFSNDSLLCVQNVANKNEKDLDEGINESELEENESQLTTERTTEQNLNCEVKNKQSKENEHDVYDKNFSSNGSLLCVKNVSSASSTESEEDSNEEEINESKLKQNDSQLRTKRTTEQNLNCEVKNKQSKENEHDVYDKNFSSNGSLLCVKNVNSACNTENEEDSNKEESNESKLKQNDSQLTTKRTTEENLNCEVKNKQSKENEHNVYDKNFSSNGSLLCVKNVSSASNIESEEESKLTQNDSQLRTKKTTERKLDSEDKKKLRGLTVDYAIGEEVLLSDSSYCSQINSVVESSDSVIHSEEMIRTDKDRKICNIKFSSKIYYNPTHTELLNLKNMRVNLIHEVPPQHKIEKTAGTRALSKTEKEEFETYSILEFGKFKSCENSRIKKNWREFCKLHNWDKNNARPFLQMKYSHQNFFLSHSDRLKFVQFLAYKLDRRSLYSVYNRFKVLYDPHKVSRYDKTEDEIIINYLKQNNKLKRKNKKNRVLADIALILKRTRASVWRRYQVLKKKKLIVESVSN